MVDEPGSLGFAEKAGFVEVDRQVEQVLAITQVPPPSAPPTGVRVIDLAEQPHLWTASYDTFASEVLADFAVFEPLQVSAEQWASSWAGEPMFVALYDGAVIGCAGLHLDTDRPERAENALTAVTREWRGRGVASYLKRLTLRWAAEHGVTEVYTWTQARNEPMLRLNEHLGYVIGRTSITLTRPLPL
jgi:GNAT superfamily N-acetyltransferase